MWDEKIACYMPIRVLRGIWCLSLDNAPLALRSLLAVSKICGFQLRCSLIQTPRYLTLELGYIRYPRSLRNEIKVRDLDLDRNKINSVLLEFREILLALSQQVKILRSALIFEQRDAMVFEKCRR